MNPAMFSLFERLLERVSLSNEEVTLVENFMICMEAYNEQHGLKVAQEVKGETGSIHSENMTRCATVMSGSVDAVTSLLQKHKEQIVAD